MCFQIDFLKFFAKDSSGNKLIACFTKNYQFQLLCKVFTIFPRRLCVPVNWAENWNESELCCVTDENYVEHTNMLNTFLF